MSSMNSMLRAATDHVTVDLEAAVLNEMRRRRRRNRTATVAGTAAGVATIVAASVLAFPALTNSTTTPTPPPSAPTTDVDTETPPPRQQASWDPGGVDDLPPAPRSVAPLLPNEIRPPVTSPALSEAPVQAAVVAVVDSDKPIVHLLGTDGSWRSVPTTGEYAEPKLSPDGTRLVVYRDFQGATVHDLATGNSRAIPYPADYRRFDGTTWTFIDENTLLLQAGDRGWRIDATSGAAEPLPHELAGAADVDPSGSLFTLPYGAPEPVVDYSRGSTRELDLDDIGAPTSMAFGSDAVAATVSDGNRPLAVVVADREALSPSAVLNVRDPDARLSNGGLSVLSLTNDGTVLLRLAGPGNRTGLRVVAWNPTTGALSQVTSPVIGIVTFADALLRD